MSRELDTATKYFINELQPDTLKLQKLLYFTQGISFCMNDEEFFDEQFEAWVHGPVVPSVYHEYKSYGYNPINVNYDIQDINERQKSILDYVKVNYGKYDGKYLEELTHKQTPWLYARQGLDPDERDDKNMPKEIIADYFIGLMFQPTTEIWA
jgi:uncharacterized phage-associated protein